MNKHEILIKGFFKGEPHEIPVKKWLPTGAEYEELGKELTILIWSDGNINDAHERTTYIIFKNVEQVEKYVPDE